MAFARAATPRKRELSRATIEASRLELPRFERAQRSRGGGHLEDWPILGGALRSVFVHRMPRYSVHFVGSSLSTNRRLASCIRGHIRRLAWVENRHAPTPISRRRNPKTIRRRDTNCGYHWGYLCVFWGYRSEEPLQIKPMARSRGSLFRYHPLSGCFHNLPHISKKSKTPKLLRVIRVRTQPDLRS